MPQTIDCHGSASLISRKASGRPVSLPPPDLRRVTREDLLAQFLNAWELTDYLFSSLVSEAAFYAQPERLRQPLIFYYAHPAAFYIAKLRSAGLLHTPLDGQLVELFQRGVDPAEPGRLPHQQWPSLSRVVQFRRRVQQVVADAIGSLEFAGPSEVTGRHPVWSILMGIEHERIHFETSSVLLRQCDLNLVRGPADWTYAPQRGKGVRSQMVFVPAGRAVLGKPHDDVLFGWDNEYGDLEVRVGAFRVSSQLVTNRQYREFVAGGGYEQRCLWSEPGWAWKTRAASRGPQFWHFSGTSIDYRAMFGQFALPEDWPVEVNCFQAQAYCRWLGAGYRLPSEAEFARMLAIQQAHEQGLPGERYNHHFVQGSPAPVGSSSAGCLLGDLLGNVWQWLRDDFYPLPGFREHPYYPDFSSPFFGAEHGMLRGGSWATTGAAASRYYRLWFRRFFFQHAGFRVAKSVRQ